MCSQAADAYTGTEILEVMKEAVNYNRFLIDLVESHCRPNDLVVDFGAGAGTFATPLRERGHNVACVELDQGLRQRLLDQGFAAHADIAEMPDASVDFIYTLNVLEHIEDDGAALRLLRSKLKPNGRLLIYVPAFQSLFSSMDRKVGHFRRYHRGPLGALLRESGFTVQRNEYVDSLGYAATLVYKAMGDESGEVNVRALIAYDRFAFPLSRLLDLPLSRVLGKNLLVVEQRQG